MFHRVSIETVQDYWDRRPCNVRHSPKPPGSREYFDEVERKKYFVEPHIPVFADFASWKGKRVLEIGCGIGTDTINFARAGAQVTAVDLSPGSLALARRRAEIFGGDITFYQGDAEHLTSFVPVREYDLVYSFGVIHHTPHPWMAIEQIKSYLGPQSRFKIMVYHRHSWKVLWIILKYGRGRFGSLDELVARYSEAQTGCPITYTYSKRSIRDLLKGFRVEGVMVDHIFPYSIPAYKENRYERTWYFRHIPRPVFLALERAWGWHLCVTATLEQVGGRFSQPFETFISDFPPNH